MKRATTTSSDGGIAALDLADVYYGEGENETLCGGAANLSAHATCTGNLGAIDDGDALNTEFVDLIAFCNQTRFGQWNDANPGNGSAMQ
ncbi:hypothetical protein MASR2M74_03840 [Paracoccaceae bacterium]